MSVTAVGLTAPLVGPQPVPRRFSLLRTPGIVVEEVGEGETPRWMAGVNVEAYPAGTPVGWEPCATGTNRVKATSPDNLFGLPALPMPRFDPIAIYFPIECSTLGEDFDVIAAKAEAALDATLSHGVEEALAQGVQFSTNRFFGDANLVQLNGGVAVNPRVGLSFLEEAIGIRSGREGLIHATPAVVTAWGYGELDTETGGEVGEPTPPVVLRSPVGTPIISGSGYQNTLVVGGPNPNATSDWVFATGPVEVRIGDGPRTTVEESTDRNINLITVRAERFVLADWDAALQVGVLIDWSLS